MSTHSKNKALFLDRDGTLIVDKGYLCDPKEVQLLPYVKETLQYFWKNQWLVFLFSNQSGVGRGYYSLEQAQLCNERMLELLGAGSHFFQKVCLATELPDENVLYRKPSPRFILECIEEFNLDRNACWMIGDNLTDVQAGLSANIHAALLGPEQNTRTDYICVENLKQFQLWLERHDALSH